jgi:hypothetical protein
VPGAKIYYATNGWTPDTNSNLYSGPITVSSSETLIAIAISSGYATSNPAAAYYTIDLNAAAAPVILPAGGVYSSAQLVSITGSTPNAAIYYTTDGSAPTVNSTQYTGPFTVSADMTIYAIAVAPGSSVSSVSSSSYLFSGTTTPIVYSFAGNGTPGDSGDGGPATLAEVNDGQGLTFDRSGNLYFSDGQNCVVRRIAAGTQIISTVAGNGICGYNGDGGQATSAGLSSPSGLALDTSGNLYIADGTRIRKVTSTGVISTYASGFKTATSIAFDGSGNLFVADQYAYQVFEVDAATQSVTSAAGNSTGYSTFQGSGGIAANASFSGPLALAFDSAGNLFIGDRSMVVFKMTAVSGIPPSQWTISIYAQYPDVTTNGIAIDGSNNLFVATYGENIEKVSANGTISTFAGEGTCDSSNKVGCLIGDGGPATSAMMNPGSLAFDSSGNLYFFDSYGWYSSARIREIINYATPPTAATVAPTISLATGSYGSAQTVTISDTTPGAVIYYTLDGSVPVPVGVNGYHGPFAIDGPVTIQAIAIAPGSLPSATVSATYNFTSQPSATISTFAGNGGVNSLPGWYYSNIPAAEQELLSPHFVASDRAGNIYIPTNDDPIDGGSILQVSPGTGEVINANAFGWGGAIAVDTSGNIYITDYLNGNVREYIASTGTTQLIAGSGSTGSVGGVGDGGVTIIDSSGNSTSSRATREKASNNLPKRLDALPASDIGDGGLATDATLGSPVGLALDGLGNLYIADGENERIRKVVLSTGIISTVAGTGVSGFSGDNGPATNANLNLAVNYWYTSANLLATDASGNVYVMDQYGAAIRKIDSASGVITTVAGSGKYGNAGDAAPATNAKIAAHGIALDPAGNIFLSSGSTVREVSASSGIITTVAGSSLYGYWGDGGSALLAGAGSLYGMAFDRTGNLFVADPDNNRVREITFANNPAQTALPTFSSAAGTYTGAQSISISSTTAGATIYYSIDGSAPTTSSTIYNGPITVSANETIKAIAVASGYFNSLTATAAYVIQTAQTISFTALSTPVTYGAAPVTLAATASSGLPVTFSVVSGPATISGDTLTFTGAGTVMVAADQSGNATFAGAPEVTQTIGVVNPAPVLSQLSPALTDAGSAAFTLTVTGRGFVSGSTVYWGSTALTTTYGSATQLTAQVTELLIALAGTTAITVQTPAPGGGTSNVLQFEVDSSSGSATAPTTPSTVVSITAGSTATYSISFPAAVTSATATCLNLPAGAICSYSSVTKVLTISTASTTPAGTYQVTVVFAETVTRTATAGILLPILLLPLFFLRKRLASGGILSAACLGLILLATTTFTISCGGASSSTQTKTQNTQTVTSSGVVALTVQ